MERRLFLLSCFLISISLGRASYIEWCEETSERRRSLSDKCGQYAYVYPYPDCYCFDGIVTVTIHKDSRPIRDVQFGKNGCFSHKSFGGMNHTIELVNFAFDKNDSVVGFDENISPGRFKFHKIKGTQGPILLNHSTLVIYNAEVFDSGEEINEHMTLCVQKTRNPEAAYQVRYYQLFTPVFLWINETCDGGNYVDLELISMGRLLESCYSLCKAKCPNETTSAAEKIRGIVGDPVVDYSNSEEFGIEKVCQPIPQRLVDLHSDLNYRTLKHAVDRAFHDNQNYEYKFKPEYSFKIMELLAKVAMRYCRHAKIRWDFLERSLEYFKIAHEGRGFYFVEFFTRGEFKAISSMLRKCLFRMNETLQFVSEGCGASSEVTKVYKDSASVDARDVYISASHQYFDHHVILDIPWNLLDLANVVCVNAFSKSYRMYHKMEQGIEKLFTSELRAFWLYPDVPVFFYEHVFGPNWRAAVKNLEKCVESAYMYNPKMNRLVRPQWISGHHPSHRHKGTLVDPICKRRRIDLPLLSDNYEIYCASSQSESKGDLESRGDGVPELGPDDILLDLPDSSGPGVPGLGPDDILIDLPESGGQSIPGLQPDDIMIDLPESGGQSVPGLQNDDIMIDLPESGGQGVPGLQNDDVMIDLPESGGQGVPGLQNDDVMIDLPESGGQGVPGLQNDDIMIDLPESGGQSVPGLQNDDIMIDLPGSGGQSAPGLQNDDIMIDLPESGGQSVPGAQADDIQIDLPESGSANGQDVSNLGPDDILVDLPGETSSGSSSSGKSDYLQTSGGVPGLTGSEIMLDLPDDPDNQASSGNSVQDQTGVSGISSGQGQQTSGIPSDTIVLDYPDAESVGNQLGPSASNGGISPEPSNSNAPKNDDTVFIKWPQDVKKSRTKKRYTHPGMYDYDPMLGVPGFEQPQELDAPPQVYPSPENLQPDLNAYWPPPQDDPLLYSQPTGGVQDLKPNDLAQVDESFRISNLGKEIRIDRGRTPEKSFANHARRRAASIDNSLNSDPDRVYITWRNAPGQPSIGKPSSLSIGNPSPGNGIDGDVAHISWPKKPSEGMSSGGGTVPALPESNPTPIKGGGGSSALPASSSGGSSNSENVVNPGPEVFIDWKPVNNSVSSPTDSQGGEPVFIDWKSSQSTGTPNVEGDIALLDPNPATANKVPSSSSAPDSASPASPCPCPNSTSSATSSGSAASGSAASGSAASGSASASSGSQGSSGASDASGQNSDKPNAGLPENSTGQSPNTKPKDIKLDWPKTKDSDGATPTPTKEGPKDIKLDWPNMQGSDKNETQAPSNSGSNGIHLDWPTQAVSDKTGSPATKPKDVKLDWPQLKGSEMPGSQGKEGDDQVDFNFPGTNNSRSVGPSSTPTDQTNSLASPPGSPPDDPTKPEPENLPGAKSSDDAFEGLDNLLNMQQSELPEKIERTRSASSVSNPIDYKPRASASGRYIKMDQPINYQPNGHNTYTFKQEPYTQPTKQISSWDDAFESAQFPQFPKNSAITESYNPRDAPVACPPAPSFLPLGGNKVNCGRKFFTCIPEIDSQQELLLVLQCNEPFNFNPKLQDCVKSPECEAHQKIIGTATASSDSGRDRAQVVLGTSSERKNKQKNAWKVRTGQTEEFGVTCSKSGMMNGKAGDCRTYYVCLNVYGKWYASQYECSPGYHFAPDIGCLEGPCSS